MTARRCDVCLGNAPGAMPCPELRMTLCMYCDADLVEHMTAGGAAETWPRLEGARRAAVTRAGVAARDRVRDRKANAPGDPVDEAVREQARHGIAVIRERRRGVL